MMTGPGGRVVAGGRRCATAWRWRRQVLERNGNHAWQGFRHVDCGLRWERIERPEGVPVRPTLPIVATTSGTAAPSCATRPPLTEEGR